MYCKYSKIELIRTIWFLKVCKNYKSCFYLISGIDKKKKLRQKNRDELKKNSPGWDDNHHPPPPPYSGMR